MADNSWVRLSWFIGRLVYLIPGISSIFYKAENVSGFGRTENYVTASLFLLDVQSQIQFLK